MSARLSLEVGRKRGHVSARLYSCKCCTYPAPGRPLTPDPPVDPRVDGEDTHYEFARDDFCASCRQEEEDWYWASIEDRFTVTEHKTLTTKLGDRFT